MVYMYHVQFVVNINVFVLIDTLELVDEFCHYSQKKPTANGKSVGCQFNYHPKTQVEVLPNLDQGNHKKMVSVGK